MAERAVRAGFASEVRISLAEADLDQMEGAIESIQEQLRRLTLAVVGAALSLTTASVLLALNLVARG